MGVAVDDILELVHVMTGAPSVIAEEPGHGRCYAGVIREVHGLSRLHSDDAREKRRISLWARSYQLGVDAGVGAGLLCYPSLQAADILLYDADCVPVGADQQQHVEISRDIAGRFNALFGNTFKIPDALIRKSGGRIMGLDDPTAKMSKSLAERQPGHAISLLDPPKQARKAIMRAVTDSRPTIDFAEEAEQDAHPRRRSGSRHRCEQACPSVPSLRATVMIPVAADPAQIREHVAGLTEHGYAHFRSIYSTAQVETTAAAHSHHARSVLAVPQQRAETLAPLPT